MSMKEVDTSMSASFFCSSNFKKEMTIISKQRAIATIKGENDSFNPLKSETAGTHVSAVPLMIWNRRKMYIFDYSHKGK